MRLMHCLVGVLALVATLGFVSPASAQMKKLKVGSTAPALTVAEWLNGSQTVIEQDKVYVVEFWATWCGPCKKSIPHLNQMHNELSSKGVVMIGVSNEKPEVVRPFVEKKGSGMSYLVAIDEGNQTTGAWLEAAGQEGIPCAFVVGKDRKIAWIGHPLDPEFDDVVRGLADGSWSPEDEKRAGPTIDAARKAAKIKNFRDAYTHYDNAVAVNPKHFAPVAREKYRVMLLDAKDQKAAAEYGKSLLKLYGDNPAALGDFAVMIMTEPELKDVRDVELANAAAELMLKVGGRQDPHLLDRYAIVQFNSGKVAEAVDTQTQAWMAAAPAEKPAYKQRLDNYKAALNRAASAKAGS
ncbi:MAG: redoxin domain-containing protein [Phycisphaerae bacterium]|nr:redoxin domain-containing protein [Phycisphaerae bacterium]